MGYVCDDCGGKILLIEESSFLFREREYKGQPAREEYFSCPHCGRRYITRIETPKKKKMQEQMAEIDKQIKLLAQLVAKGTTGKVLKKYNSLVQKKERLWFKMVSEHDKLKRHFKELDEKESKSLD